MNVTRLCQFLCCLLITTAANSQDKHGKVITDTIASSVLKENLLGVDANRKVMIYLPPGYETSKQSYPVLYYCHSMFGSADIIMQGAPIVKLSERAFTKGVINELIIVVADYSTSGVGSLYENSPVSGRWLDFTTKELVPYIDKKFRTIPQAESRAIVGDFMGGRGAIKLAMNYPDIFSVMYAMHPVALGMGYLPWTDLGIDWKKILNAKSPNNLADLQGDGRIKIFVAVCQAFLPNPSKPPFYCDFYMELHDGKVTLNAEKMAKAKKGFMLEDNIIESASNLRKLRGFAFDWARDDGNFDHVFAARVFSRDLDDAGVEHEAEEYRGNPWNQNWPDNGRFYARVLPFLSRYLLFEKKR